VVTDAVLRPRVAFHTYIWLIYLPHSQEQDIGRSTACRVTAIPQWPNQEGLPMTNTRLPFMRSHYAIAVVAVILIGFGVKLFFFRAPAVEAGVAPGANASMNILQIHRDHPNIKDLPVLDVKDPF
jgi:hypothetical protein